MHFDHLYFSMLSLALKEYQFMTNMIYDISYLLESFLEILLYLYMQIYIELLLLYTHTEVQWCQ